MDSLNVPQVLEVIVKEIAAIGGKAYLVGGYVRDFFVGRTSKDIDVEVYGLDSVDTLVDILSRHGKVDIVGRSFGVVKLSTAGEDFDFSFPRRETKIAEGHKGFIVEPDPSMTLEEAARRRDFTMNAVAYNLLADEFVDPFGGIDDIRSEVIRHTSESFSEDPLRVLRAVQFAGRFGFTIEPETMLLCRQLDLSELPKERIFEEWKKLLLKSPAPSVGLNAAKQLGVLKFFPELEALLGVPQDLEWHPEGSVWTHNNMVIDEAAKLRSGDDRRDLCLMFGALCHDFGKATTTEFIDGRWRARGHESLGEEPTRAFLERMTNQEDLIENVVALVKHHLAPALYMRNGAKNGAVRRLSLKVDIPLLCDVSTADHFGRLGDDPKHKRFEARDWLLDKAASLGVKEEKPRSYLLGRHLIELGLKPGPEFSKIIAKCFELQLDGDIRDVDEAVDWARQYIEQQN